jgi:hypothetical protein
LLLSTQFLSWRRRERIDKEEEEEDNGWQRRKRADGNVRRYCQTMMSCSMPVTWHCRYHCHCQCYWLMSKLMAIIQLHSVEVRAAHEGGLEVLTAVTADCVMWFAEPCCLHACIFRAEGQVACINYRNRIYDISHFSDNCENHCDTLWFGTHMPIFQRNLLLPSSITPWRWRQKVRLKPWYPLTNIQNVTHQKTVFLKPVVSQPIYRYL